MPNWFALPSLALATLLAGTGSAMAQASAVAGAGNVWLLVVPNAAVALLALGWLLLMARRGG